MLNVARKRPAAQGSSSSTELFQDGKGELKTSVSDVAPAKNVSCGAAIANYLPATLAGLVCGLIQFVFCCVFASMVFQQPGMPAEVESAVPLGVGMHTVSVMTGSLIFAWGSGCKAVIAGPDMLPVVFVAEATTAIVEMICPAGEDGRRLAGGSGSAHGSGRVCPSDVVDKLVPTVLAGCAVASLLVGLAFFIIVSASPQPSTSFEEIRSGSREARRSSKRFAAARRDSQRLKARAACHVSALRLSSLHASLHAPLLAAAGTAACTAACPRCRHRCTRASLLSLTARL